MKNVKNYIFIASAMFLTSVASTQAATISGVIKGAQCYLKNTQCIESKDDPHLALENDFILVSGSEYYFLPNLPRREKIKIYNQTVSVEGNISKNKINVNKVMSKLGNKDKIIWDWNEIQNDLYEG